ncbi:MAG: YdeI/OmpD-associated family protein [Trueperaceae bacterium]
MPRDQGQSGAPTTQGESPSPIDAYVETFDGAVRMALEELRDLLREALPGATETISYGIPTFDLNGKHVVHFAGYTQHVGLYPTPSGMKAFDAELARYARGKGSARFPLSEPLPVDLIRRIAAFRLDEVTAAGASKPRRTSPSKVRSSAARQSARPARRERHPMPDDVRDALEAAALMNAYRERPPYQQNDYLGWIAGAKREDTRARRRQQMLDELAEGSTYMKMAWVPGEREG